MKRIIFILIACILPFTVANALTFSSYYGSVNVKDYGAVGNGSTDDTSSIQAAIDAAYAAKIQTIYIPPTGSCYKTTSSLFLDAPGNLRSSLANPTIFAFSLALVGERGIGNHEGYGSRICPNFNNSVALWVGPGQGMHVQGLQIVGPSVGGAPGYRGGQNVSGVGIGIAGGSGGASRTLIEDTQIENFYAGIKTSANGNGALADSTTLTKVSIQNTAIGFYSAGTQNFINSLYDTNINYSTTAVRADVGTGATIVGGNYSGVSAVAASFTISSVSAITAAAAGNNFNYTFTATVASPDAYLTSSIYNAYTIATTRFGVIPITMTAFNAGTAVATFQILPTWSAFYFPSNNATTMSDLQTQVQAVATLYATEMLTTFVGAKISVSGVHIENPVAATTFFDAGAGFGSSRPNRVENVFFNYDPGLPTYRPSTSPTADNLARYYAAMTFPFIRINNQDLEIINSALGIEVDPVIVDFYTDGSSGFRLIMKDFRAFKANVRNGGNGGFDFFSTRTQINTASLGGGEYDQTPFVTGHITDADALRSAGWGSSPFWGWRPAHYAMPSVAPAELTVLAGALPAISHTSSGSTINYTIGYPLLWGGQIYKLWDWYVGLQANYTFLSNHHFYSYGQDLTTTNVPNLAWTYKGQSSMVYANIEALNLMFAGLGQKLNDGSSDVLYMTTGVYPGLGYYTVTAACSINCTSRLSGLKTSTFTGTTIKQEAYSLQYPQAAQ